MRKEDDLYDEEEGARPSSLVPVHKLSTPDRLYDLQLLRCVAIVNERTLKELGPPPRGERAVKPERKPEAPSTSQPGTTPSVVADHSYQEKDTMKLLHLAMVAALGVATASNSMAHGITVSEGVEVSKRELGPEYKKIRTFTHFRKKLIEDGWVPIPNPDCHDAVFGASYDSYCSKDPDSIGCRVCTMVPEVFRSTSDGYNLMRYTKDGVPLGVTVYGDLNDLDAPGRYGLVVVGWDYSTGLNVILLDD